MNKKVSKTLAAVLSAAMAASAFAVSTGAAFAADTDNQISATVEADSIGISSSRVSSKNTAVTGINLKTLVEGTGSTHANGLVPTFTVNGVDYEGGYIVLDPNTAWEIAPNDMSMLDLNQLQKNMLMAGTGAQQNMTRSRTVKISHTATAYAANVGLSGTSKEQLTGQHVTVEIDVTIYPNGKKIILPATAPRKTAPTTGSAPTSEETISMNQSLDLDTYTIGTNSAGKVTFTKNTESQPIGYESDNTSVVKVNATTGLVDPQSKETPQTGSAVVKATGTNYKDAIPFMVTVDDTYKVMDTTSFTASGSETVSNDGYKVEGKNIVVDLDADYKANASTAGITVGADAVVGDIDAHNDNVNITVTGKTGNIDAEKNVYVQDNNGYPKAGTTITTGDITSSEGAITVNGTGAQSNVTGQYADIQTGDLKAAQININAYDNNDQNQPAARGKVSIGDITIKRDSQGIYNVAGLTTGGLTLNAGKYVNTMTLGSISGEAGPYADSPFGAQVTVKQGTFADLGDLKNVGKVTIGTNSTTANATVGTIDTGTVGSSTYTDKTINASTVQVNAGSALTADKITTNQILSGVGSGYGSMTLSGPDSLVIKNINNSQSSATNTYLYVTGAKPGDTLYTAYNTSGRNYIFMPTASKVLGVANSDKSYSFKLQEVGFEGIRMTNTKVEVGQDPATLTLAALPDSASLPDGVTVAWTATTDKAGKQTVKLTPSADGMTCQVEATGYTPENINGGNDVTVTATLMKDGKAYKADGVVSSAQASVTLTNKTAARPLTGISLNKTSTVMKPKETRQLTVSYAPEDTTDNKTVTWTSSDPAIATVDKNGLVTGVAYGKTTITAKVGDFTATCNVTISASGMIVKVTDLDGNVTECAPDGSTTVDIPQSTAYRVELTSDETINEFSYNAGNGKVGGTNTLSVWNGTAGTYEAYAAGKPGEQTGFYVNGDKLFNLQVVSRPFVSDTTMTANVPVGKSYTFRITLNDKNAKFTFSTANGEALATSYKKATYPDANGDYYCTVTTKKAVGNVGVYCNIDGKNYKVFAVNTRA